MQSAEQNSARSTRLQSIVALTVCLCITFSIAFFGTQFAPDAWYQSIAKPTWNPPNWIFGPVWTVLYTLIAVAAWRVWRKGHARIPLTVWILHLVPNALWSYFFFGAKRMDWALVDILVLLIGIVATMALFAQRDRIAAWLMVPYLLWVSFATLLNWTLLSLNWKS